MYGFYLVGITTVIVTLVRVVLFGINAAIFNDEVECVVHETAIATLVVFQIAVNQLLLRQRHSFSGANCIDTLNRSNS
jgi:hypothetical protein